MLYRARADSSPCFFPGADWKRIVAKHRLGDRFIFKVEFVESRWDSLSQTHTITFRRVESGETFEVEADVLISATGALNRPITPNVPGRDDFRGLQWHSSRWNTDVDLKGKKIAIVGNGSSGIQVIPNIADLEGIEIVQLQVDFLLLLACIQRKLTIFRRQRPLARLFPAEAQFRVFPSSKSRVPLRSFRPAAVSMEDLLRLRLHHPVARHGDLRKRLAREALSGELTSCSLYGLMWC